jgi:hypothetical protein
MIIQIVGYTFGPLVVPLLTERVFHDPSKVKLACALTAAIFVPLAAVCFAIGQKPMREAVRLAAAPEG